MESSRAGIGPMSPALTGGSSTTGPPGKPYPKCSLDLAVKPELKSLNYGIRIMAWESWRENHGVRMPLLQSCLCLLPCQAKGFPRGSVSTESACNAGDPGLVPESGRSLGEGNGNSFQCFCQENSMDRGARQGCSPQDCKESDTTVWLTFSFSHQAKKVN